MKKKSNREKEIKEYKKISAIIDQAFRDAKMYIKKNKERQASYATKRFAAC